MSKRRVIHEAAVTDATLEGLVLCHRDNAGRAHRIVQREQDEAHYAGVQNGWADIFQELLDRRRQAK
jgi:hypothetical protein